MIKTISMTGDRQELPIDLGVEINKISNRITENEKFMDNGFGACYEGLVITAGEDNINPILISDYTEDKQVNTETECDFIEMKPKSQIVLPWNREVQAFNRPMVLGTEGDILMIVAR